MLLLFSTSGGGGGGLIGDASITQADNTIASAAVILISAISNAVQAGDSLASSALLQLMAALSITQAANSVSSSGSRPVAPPPERIFKPSAELRSVTETESRIVVVTPANRIVSE